MIFYTESAGIAINITTSVVALLLIAFSVYKMTKRDEGDAAKSIWIRFALIVIVQLLTVLAAIGAVLLVGVIIDAMGLSECWYSEEWLLFGLYFCPLFCILGLFPAIFIHWTRNKVIG